MILIKYKGIYVTIQRQKPTSTGKSVHILNFFRKIKNNYIAINLPIRLYTQQNFTLKECKKTTNLKLFGSSNIQQDIKRMIDIYIDKAFIDGGWVE